MRNKVHWVRQTALLAMLCAASVSAGDPQPPQFHMMPIRRLAPREFHQLPQPIVRALEARGCSIPQLWTYDDPHFKSEFRKPRNVIRGSFRQRGQVDWAVLCSCEDSSSIVIFWDQRASGATELDRSRDEGWTQDVDGQGNLGYSRFIAKASPERILRDNPGVKTMHDGIEEGFAEKGSTIYYYGGGRWTELGGAD